MTFIKEVTCLAFNNGCLFKLKSLNFIENLGLYKLVSEHSLRESDTSVCFDLKFAALNVFKMIFINN